MWDWDIENDILSGNEGLIKCVKMEMRSQTSKYFFLERYMTPMKTNTPEF
jgi:hypothetical protein